MDKTENITKFRIAAVGTQSHTNIRYKALSSNQVAWFQPRKRVE
jgi:hypothetical protein